jgi:hypothetical protein
VKKEITHMKPEKNIEDNLYAQIEELISVARKK